MRRNMISLVVWKQLRPVSELTFVSECLDRFHKMSPVPFPNRSYGTDILDSNRWSMFQYLPHFGPSTEIVGFSLFLVMCAVGSSVTFSSRASTNIYCTRAVTLLSSGCIPWHFVFVMHFTDVISLLMLTILRVMVPINKLWSTAVNLFCLRLSCFLKWRVVELVSHGFWQTLYSTSYHHYAFRCIQKREILRVFWCWTFQFAQRIVYGIRQYPSGA